MNYRSLSPQLKSSCYNCSYFQASDDMLNGLCFQQSSEHGVEAIGVGTCGEFTMKGDAGAGSPLFFGLPRTRRKAALARAVR